MTENTGEIDLKKIVKQGKESFYPPPPPDFVPAVFAPKDSTQDLEIEAAMPPDDAQRAMVKFYSSLESGVEPFSLETATRFRAQVGNNISDNTKISDLIINTHAVKRIKYLDPTYYEQIRKMPMDIRKTLVRALSIAMRATYSIPKGTDPGTRISSDSVTVGDMRQRGAGFYATQHNAGPLTKSVLSGFMRQ